MMATSWGDVDGTVRALQASPGPPGLTQGEPHRPICTRTHTHTCSQSQTHMHVQCSVVLGLGPQGLHRLPPTLGGHLLTAHSPSPPGFTSMVPTFSPLMKRSFSLRFTWSMERPCSARDSKATVPSGLDTTRPFLPVIWDSGRGNGSQLVRPCTGWSLPACFPASPPVPLGLLSVCAGGAANGSQDSASAPGPQLPTGRQQDFHSTLSFLL